jgi:hypothetical protein
VIDEQPTAGSTLVIGLVADPGLPYQLAREIAADLAEELHREVCDQWVGGWRPSNTDSRPMNRVSSL